MRKELSILETIKNIVPNPKKIAEATALEHDEAKRLHENMIIILSHMVKISPLLSQLIQEQGDSIEAQGDRMQAQRRNMETMEDFMDRQSGAENLTRNLDMVFIRGHVPTVAGILDNVDPDTFSKAAKTLTRLRVMDLRNRLSDVLDQH